MKSVAKLVKQLGKAEASKAKDLWSKVEKDASTAIDAAVKMHKKLSGTSEFASLGKSIRGVEIAADGKSTLLDFQAGQVLKALETLYGDVDRITALAKSGNLE